MIYNTLSEYAAIIQQPFAEILNQFAKIQVLKMTAPVRTVLRMALYEIRYMEKVPEAVSCHEAVELLKKKEGQNNEQSSSSLLEWNG